MYRGTANIHSVESQTVNVYGKKAVILESDFFFNYIQYCTSDNNSVITETRSQVSKKLFCGKHVSSIEL